MLDDPRVEQFVGRNVAYYREQWQRFIDNPASKISFNGAALIGNVIWLAYRKLYLALFWVMVLMVADVALFIYLDEAQLVSEGALSLYGTVSSIVLLGVVALFGNYWYWKKFLKTGGLDTEAKLRAKGGTSAAAPTMLVLALTAPIAWALYHAAPVLIAEDWAGDPPFIFDRTGPLTLEEVRVNFIDRMDEELIGPRRDCVLGEIEKRVSAAGDPETLDPSSVEMLPTENWGSLDAEGKRLILSQVITTKAFFECPRRNF